MTMIAALHPEQQDFLAHITAAWQTQQFERLILSQYQGQLMQLQKVIVRPIQLKGQRQVHVVYRYQSKDISKNYTWEDFLQFMQDEGLRQFLQLNGFMQREEIQLKYKKSQWKLTTIRLKHNATLVEQNHNRDKKRWIIQEKTYLQRLGITDAKQQIIPTMARKWKQINKFVEIFAGALKDADLLQQQDIHVVDFGSGKGYLTCAVYDYLLEQDKQPQVTGVELRTELVDFCQNVATQVGYHGLNFFQGDVRSYQPQQTDVMIALHACDIATDFAIHTGIRLGAKVIMCAPCCHKELRPQLQAEAILQPMLQFGVHAGQQAEMLTDTLRALLLQAYGYQTKILEFVSLEHTSKNKMILAVKKQHLQQPDAQILAQITALKAFYGISHHTLERLLSDLSVDSRQGCAC